VVSDREVIEKQLQLFRQLVHVGNLAGMASAILFSIIAVILRPVPWFLVYHPLPAVERHGLIWQNSLETVGQRQPRRSNRVELHFYQPKNSSRFVSAVTSEKLD
jgi:hypothetical protein